MADQTELDDLRGAIDALRAATRGTPEYTAAIDRLVGASDRAATRLRAGDVGADERAQLVKLVADAIAVIGRAFGGGAVA